MNLVETVSVVLPVRNIQSSAQERVQQVLDALEQISRGVFEVVVVDDGSSDQTADVIRELKSQNHSIQLIRNSRPRGLECAGQTGLERARGELVFIQETNHNVRIDDQKRLFRLSSDSTIVAARAESQSLPIAPALLRRMKAWGTNLGDQIGPTNPSPSVAGLQMIRRPHLKKLRTPQGSRYRLVGETSHAIQVKSPRADLLKDRV